MHGKCKKNKHTPWLCVQSSGLMTLTFLMSHLKVYIKTVDTSTVSIRHFEIDSFKRCRSGWHCFWDTAWFCIMCTHCQNSPSHTVIFCKPSTIWCMMIAGKHSRHCPMFPNIFNAIFWSSHQLIKINVFFGTFVSTNFAVTFMCDTNDIFYLPHHCAIHQMFTFRHERTVIMVSPQTCHSQRL